MVESHEIAPNMRHVVYEDRNMVTISIPWDEREAFQNWFVEQGLEAMGDWHSSIYAHEAVNYGEPETPSVKAYVFMSLTTEQVAHMKLMWARYEIVDA